MLSVKSACSDLSWCLMSVFRYVNGAKLPTMMNGKMLYQKMKMAALLTLPSNKLSKIMALFI